MNEQIKEIVSRTYAKLSQMYKRDTEKDILILADVFYRELFFNDHCEYGSPTLDCKRPFGNSDVEADILEMLEWEPEGDDGYGPCYSSKQREYAKTLYTEELVPFLKAEWQKSHPPKTEYIPEPPPPPPYPLSLLHFHSPHRFADVAKIPVEDTHEELFLTEEELKKINGEACRKMETERMK